MNESSNNVDARWGRVQTHEKPRSQHAQDERSYIRKWSDTFISSMASHVSFPFKGGAGRVGQGGGG